MVAKAEVKSPDVQSNFKRGCIGCVVIRNLLIEFSKGPELLATKIHMAVNGNYSYRWLSIVTIAIHCSIGVA